MSKRIAVILTKIISILCAIVLIGVNIYFFYISKDADSINASAIIILAILVNGYIFIYAAALIGAIWIIYAMINSKFLKGRHSTKLLFPVLLIIFLVLVSPFIMFNNEQNIKYCITYYEDIYRYEACKTDKLVEVNKKSTKEKRSTEYIINFSDKNMTLINDFFDSQFKDKNSKRITLNTDNLTQEQLITLKSIIYNNEQLLNYLGD